MNYKTRFFVSCTTKKNILWKKIKYILFFNVKCSQQLFPVNETKQWSYEQWQIKAPIAYQRPEVGNYVPNKKKHRKREE